MPLWQYAERRFFKRSNGDIVLYATCDGAKHTRGMCDNVFMSLHHRRLRFCFNCRLWYVFQTISWNLNDLTRSELTRLVTYPGVRGS